MDISLDYESLSELINNIEKQIENHRTSEGLLYDPEGNRYKLFYLYQLLRDKERSQNFLTWYDEEFLYDYGGIEIKFIRALILFNLGEEDATSFLNNIYREKLNFIPQMLNLDLYSCDGYPDTVFSPVHFNEELQIVIKEMNQNEIQWILEVHNSKVIQDYIELTINHYKKINDLLSSKSDLSPEIEQYYKNRSALIHSNRNYDIPIPIPESRIDKYEKIISAVWNYRDDYQINPRRFFSEIMRNVGNYLFNGNHESISIGEFIIHKEILDNDIYCYCIEQRGKSKYFESGSDKPMKGFTTIFEIQDFISVGDKFLIRDVCRILYGLLIEKAELPTLNELIEEKENDSIIYKQIEKDGIKLQLKSLDDSYQLSIGHRINTKIITINEDEIVESIKDIYDDIYAEEKRDLYDNMKYIQHSVGAVITGNGSAIDLTVYFSEEDYSMAGVYVFGNNGDSTFDNAYYWNKNEVTPLYNKGWMIWGLIEFEDESLCWYPNGYNKATDEYVEQYNEYFEESFSKKEIFDIRNRFILKDEDNIKAKLDSLGLLYPDGVVLSESSYDDYD